MEKAFDRVRRNDLFNIMLDEYYNIPRKLIRIVKNMYSVCVGKVKGAGVESDWFNIESGVRRLYMKIYSAVSVFIINLLLS